MLPKSAVDGTFDLVVRNARLAPPRGLLEIASMGPVAHMTSHDGMRAVFDAVTRLYVMRRGTMI